jgi:hypothetical protein
MRFTGDICTNTFNLPDDVIRYILEYIPLKTLVFTNKKHYNLYHSLIKSSIINYENYIRDTIRRDNSFVFCKIIAENYMKWVSIKKYAYQNIIYANYIYFIVDYCTENQSTRCRNELIEFLKEHGLCQNRHKKNIYKHIRWKN